MHGIRCLARRSFGKRRADADNASDGQLLNAFKKGKVSAVDVEDSAPKNSSRKLCRQLEKDAVLPEPYVRQIPQWDDALGQCTMQDIAVLPIHETIEVVATDDWCTFSESQRGIKKDFDAFCSKFSLDMWTQLWCVLALWGDEAPFSKRDGVLLLTYRAVSGSVRRRVWIATIRKTKLCKCGCHGRCTVNALFDIVAWMVEALVTRRWPCTDHERKAFGNHPYDRERKHNGESGKLLTRAGALLYKCADWAWLKQFCGCKGWQGITSQRLMCWLCAAGLAGRHDAYDCSADATWRQHMISMHKFWAENPHGNLSHIWKILGMDIGRILPDWMHVVCLGILQAVQGNVMWHLFKKRLSGTFKNPAVALTKLMNMMKFSAAILGVEKPFNKLSMGMIRSSSTHKPKLKLKAAEGRHFLPVLIHMMQSLFGILNPYEQMMVHCLQALQNCYVLLDANPWDPTCKLRL